LCNLEDFYRTPETAPSNPGKEPLAYTIQTITVKKAEESKFYPVLSQTFQFKILCAITKLRQRSFFATKLDIKWGKRHHRPCRPLG